MMSDDHKRRAYRGRNPVPVAAAGGSFAAVVVLLSMLLLVVAYVAAPGHAPGVQDFVGP
jgi:hypothetical protein